MKKGFSFVLSHRFPTVPPYYNNKKSNWILYLLTNCLGPKRQIFMFFQDMYLPTWPLCTSGRLSLFFLDSLLSGSADFALINSFLRWNTLLLYSTLSGIRSVVFSMPLGSGVFPFFDESLCFSADCCVGMTSVFSHDFSNTSSLSDKDSRFHQSQQCLFLWRWEQTNYITNVYQTSEPTEYLCLSREIYLSASLWASTFLTKTTVIIVKRKIDLRSCKYAHWT